MLVHGIATIYTLRRFYILMRRTTISHFSFLISHSIRALLTINGQYARELTIVPIPNKKSEPFFQKGSDHLVPEAGLEPARCRHRQILSLVRLPFRHSGISIVCIVAYLSTCRQ